MRFTAACAVLVVLLLVSGTANGRSTSSAPGFTSGPRVVAGGLLWSGASGVAMTSPSGQSRVVARGASLSAVVSDQSWIAVSGRAGVRAARFGHRLLSVALPRRCLPVESPAGSEPRVPLLALTRGDLYAVIAAPCVHASGVDGPVLVRVRLPRGAALVLAHVPAGAAAIAAAGPRLALTYLAGSPPRAAHVDVRSATSGHSLFTVSFPALEPAPAQVSTQVDALGDVVLTGTFFLPPGMLAEGWWGNQRHRVGRVLYGLEVGAPPEPIPYNLESSGVASALSDGLLAYPTYAHGRGETVDVRDLATNTTRTVVTFTGSAGVLGIGLRRNHLAWAQQSLGFTTPTTTQPCVLQTEALGPVQLVEATLGRATRITEPGAPVPPSTGPLCPPPP